MSKKVALLIGVGQYGEGFPSLSAAPHDVAALKQVLQNLEMAGFDQVDDLINPDLVEMLTAIGKLFHNRKKEDLLLLYFSGHGIKDGDTNHLYLASRQTSKEGFRWEAVPARFVQQMSQFCPSRRQVLILDCCFSGAFKDGWIAKGTGLDLQQELGAEGRVVLTSSNAYEQSFQPDEEGALSLYTQYLVEGIATGAADQDKDGKIHVQELHEYAKTKVQKVKPNMQPDILLDKEGYRILLSKAPVNDPTLEFRRLVEPFGKTGEISEFRRQVWRKQWEKLGLSDEAAETVISSVLEPFRRRLASLEKFKAELQKEVENQFPLTADMETDLRDWQQQVLGLTDEDVVEIWRQVIAAKEKVAIPPVIPAAPPVPTFEFQVATLQKKTGTQNGYSIARTQKRTEFFTEKLNDNVLLDMVAIPAGSFQMGSTESDSEQPVHQVTIAPFFLGKYPVTQAQWKAVAGFPKVNHDLEPDPSGFKGNVGEASRNEKRPVEQVSWWEAVEFCDRLSRKTNKTYRLPSEAEWEYACRAGTTTPFHFGETIATDLANYNGNYTYGSGVKGEYRKTTTPVGSFGVANAFGLYDMHGNVWEWCADHWHENYQGAPIEGSAWLSDNDNYHRLLRGGSWLNLPAYCRSACRYCYDPGSRAHNLGFRVVCVLA